ncbi:putative beta-1,3-galactosyltransferase 14-like [Capsicum annuum]|nr:putative beta-1,3-galactosyltransferase 14-like [Capsicum annuum]
MEKKGSSKMNVAIIHPDLGIGGAERLIVDAAMELASLGHKVHIFTSHHDKNRCFEETLSGQKSYSLNSSHAPLCPYLTDVNARYTLVRSGLCCHSSIEVKEVCKDLLLAQHTTILRRIYRKPIDFIEEITTGMADLILVNSKFTASTFASTFKNLDARGIKPAVLYPAVNVDQFEKPNATKLNFLSINRFERKKNIELAISAFAMLHAHEVHDHQGVDMNDVSLTVAGKFIQFFKFRGFDSRLRENVEYLEELKKLAEREGVSQRVKFITSCSTAERNALLGQCLCVLYTPKDEHFGIVPLEAMAAYKPVIACNSGGPVETVKHGVTGFLCDPNPKEFASAMSNFIQDPHLSEKMGQDARQHVAESFSTKIFGQHLNRYLVDVARGKEE